MSIPVICDRCRSVGFSGDGDFSHLGDLLEFTPVPRKKERVDGWTAERQRAFIAALSATGSKRRAAQAIGMAAYGIDQMMKSEGNESFKAAFDRAMAIAKANGSMKIAAGVADAAARNAQMAGPSALRGHAPEPESEMSDDAKMELVAIIGEKFMRKVAAERRARLAGEIVAADFYLRQVTFMEVLFDLTSVSLGFDAGEVLRDLRRGGFHSRDIVGTPFSEWLDASRRQWWAQEGEPDRPPHPDTRFLQRHGTSEGDCSTYADQNAYGATTTPARGYSAEQWAEMKADEQKLARKPSLMPTPKNNGRGSATRTKPGRLRSKRERRMRNRRPTETYSNVPREHPPTVPHSVPGVQQRREWEDEDEADAFSRWLAHVEAGRIANR